MPNSNGKNWLVTKLIQKYLVNAQKLHCEFFKIQTVVNFKVIPTNVDRYQQFLMQITSI